MTETHPDWISACFALATYLPGASLALAQITKDMIVGDRHRCYWTDGPDRHITVTQDEPLIDHRGAEMIVWLVTGTGKDFEIHGWKRAKHCLQDKFRDPSDAWKYHVPYYDLRDHDDRQYDADSREVWPLNLAFGRPTTEEERA